MATVAERILDALTQGGPLDDDALAILLDISPRQTVNQAARRLHASGRLVRQPGQDGKIVNVLAAEGAAEPEAAPLSAAAAARSSGVAVLTEDEVKEAVCAHLTDLGFDVAVAWGRVRGIDLDAQHPDGRRIICEAKGEVAKGGAQQVNYFLGALGELVQRMSDPRATYALALPGHRQYRGLIGRLPALARERLGLTVFWVTRDGKTLCVEVDDGS